MKRRPEKFDAFSRHEVYDRAFAVQHLWELVEDHPVVVADKALAAEAARVSEAIATFYQKAAQKLIPHDQVMREFGLAPRRTKRGSAK